ncbi:hypothetical protein HaLaN_29652 [Haematococcus lacustris]|uniref:Uncharacterized protein n=1 Tax=Haematococcus lacustris TaxID=44745 RepID=A0A6A0AD04_HAELA|nr:hypothetical protein HaLaN_29652 [Haematococcus lacustris]
MQQLGLAKESQRASIKELAYVQSWDRWFSTGKLANRGFQFERTVETDADEDERSGQLVAGQLAWCKLTKGQGQGLPQWLAPTKPHLQHPAAASSLEANLKHITVTLATWDAVWEVYLDPKWARQRLRLYGAQDRALEQFFKQLEEDMAEVSIERHGRPKQLVVFFAQQ